MKIGKGFKKVFTAELKTILKVDQMNRKSAKEIVDIWNTFHGSLSRSVSIAMNRNKHSLFMERLEENGLFMQPILRNPEYFFVYSALYSPKIITFHSMFGNIGQIFENDPSFVVRIFDEFERSKGIFLIRGDLVDGSITKIEAEIILRGLLAHYVETDLYEDYVVPFNQDVANFKHSKFLEDYFLRFQRKSDPEENP
jgi:hypothetical protein